MEELEKQLNMLARATNDILVDIREGDRLNEVTLRRWMSAQYNRVDDILERSESAQKVMKRNRERVRTFFMDQGIPECRREYNKLSLNDS